MRLHKARQPSTSRASGWSLRSRRTPPPFKSGETSRHVRRERGRRWPPPGCDDGTHPPPTVVPSLRVASASRRRWPPGGRTVIDAPALVQPPFEVQPRRGHVFIVAAHLRWGPRRQVFGWPSAPHCQHNSSWRAIGASQEGQRRGTCRSRMTDAPHTCSVMSAGSPVVERIRTSSNSPTSRS